MKALSVIPFEMLGFCFGCCFVFFPNSEVQFKIGMLEKGWAFSNLFLLVSWAETTKHTGGVVCQENTHSDPSKRKAIRLYLHMLNFSIARLWHTARYVISTENV